MIIELLERLTDFAAQLFCEANKKNQTNKKKLISPTDSEIKIQLKFNMTFLLFSTLFFLFSYNLINRNSVTVVRHYLK